jgi:hypothetical protein
MKKSVSDIPLPVALRYLFVSKRAEDQIEKSKESKMAFVGGLLRYLQGKWPTYAALMNGGRVVANCHGRHGEELKVVVEPQLRATAVFLASEPAPTTEKIRELIGDEVAVRSPFV